MTTHEVTTVADRLRARVVAILSPEQLACYDAYQERLQNANDHHDSSPIEPTPDEQVVLHMLATDTQAAALQKQLRVLLRIETLPQ